MAELYIQHDCNGALVHIRRRDTRACVGCVEAGLFGLIEGLLRMEFMAAAQKVAAGVRKATEPR